MTLDADSTALVVVDMQNGFAHPDGTLYAPGSEAVIEPIAGLVERARDAGVQIVYTRDVHPPSSSTGTTTTTSSSSGASTSSKDRGRPK